MKRVLLLALVALMSTVTVFAQDSKSPKGLYRLKSFIYEDGRTSTPNFRQYKYAADTVGLLVSYGPSRTTTQWSRMQVEIREQHPLVYTGETPQGDDGHGTQIFNVTDDQFYFKWYNDRWRNMSELNQFITEVYVKDRMDEEVVKAFSLFENQMDTRENKFYGWWIRIGATASPDGTGKKTQVPTIWKAYGPGLSMVVYLSDDGILLRCNPTSTIRYENDSTIYETGHPCNIHWLNEDCHALTFVQENGQQLTEIWVRGGLPRNWQRVFNTDIETYRNGVDCIREAVEAALADDLNKADRLIAEAVNDKGVSIQILCEGIMGIANHLYVSKQFKECMIFCEQQLRKIDGYVVAGNEHNMLSKLHVHLIDVFKSVATYRSGDKKKGKKQMEEKIAEVESEVERYRSLGSAEPYINLLYFCNFTMYQLGYDILGSERTLMYLDFLTLMAPEMTTKNKAALLNCRGNCYLLDGNKESAKKMWQQIKELDADFFKKQSADDPLKKEFGE